MTEDSVDGAVKVKDTPPPKLPLTKNQTIVDVITAPRLRDVTFLDFIKFKKARENYERELEEKNKEPGVSVSKASYLTSVDHIVLELFVQRKYIQRDSVKDVTEEDIIDCINKRAERPKGEFELSDVEKAVKSVRMKMSIPGAEPRVDSLLLDYKRALESAGYSAFPADCPKLAIKHIMDRIKPPLLKDMMEDEFEKQDSRGLRKKNFDYFISELVRLAKIVEKTSSRRHQQVGEDKHKDDKGSKTKDRNKRKHDRGKDKGGTGSGDSGGKLGTKRGRDPPPCLHEKCKKKNLCHWLNDCDECRNDPSMKKKLLDEYRKSQGGRREKRDKNMGRMGTDESSHPTLFSAKFSETVEVLVLVDNGADDNLMPPGIFERLLKDDPKLSVTALAEPIEYSMAVDAHGRDGIAKVVCDRTVRADVQLKIRHGSTLLLRNVEWAVSKQKARHVLIGRPLLEALGLDMKNILEAACDKNNGIINVPDILPSQINPKPGTLAKFIRDSGVFHSQHGDDGFHDDDDIYIDLGEDKPGEAKAMLSERVKDAVEAGLSPKGQVQLENLLTEFEDIFRVRLGKSPPAKVEPMKVKLKLGARPLIAKTRRYKQDQRDFLNKYMNELERMGFVIKNNQAQWASAPLLVPKDSKAKFRMTVDLRAVNAATEPVSWPMPHIDSEIYDLSESNSFATIDFVSGYWQLPLDKQSQAAHSIITPNGVYSPTRTQQGATNSVANFQGKVEPLFRSLSQYLKAWLDDFIVHCKSESELLQVLRQFFR